MSEFDLYWIEVRRHIQEQEGLGNGRSKFLAKIYRPEIERGYCRRRDEYQVACEILEKHCNHIPDLSAWVGQASTY